MTMHDEAVALRTQIDQFLAAFRTAPLRLTGDLLPTSLRNLVLQLQELERNPLSNQ